MPVKFWQMIVRVLFFLSYLITTVYQNSLESSYILREPQNLKQNLPDSKFCGLLGMYELYGRTQKPFQKIELLPLALLACLVIWGTFCIHKIEVLLLAAYFR